MSRLHLLPLAAVLVSITCCSLLASAKADSSQSTINIRSVNERKSAVVEPAQKLRYTRDARKQKKDRNSKKNRKGQKDKISKRKNNRKRLSKFKQKKKNQARKPKAVRKGKSVKRNRNGRRRKAGNDKPKRKQQRQRKKGNKKGKKLSKKSRKREKKKGARKDRKKEKRARRRNRKTRRQNRQQNNTCITGLVAIAKLNGIQLRTLDRQITRIINFNKLVGAKQGKKNDFDDNRQTLLSALGGNSSQPKCGGQAVNGSESDYLTTLQNCSAVVVTACTPVLNGTKQNTVTTCNTTLTTARAEIDKITNPGTDATVVCAAVAAFPATLNNEINGCIKSLGTLDTELIKAKKACVTAFGTCRVAERSSLSVVSKCKPGSGGVANEDDAKKQLEILTKIVSALSDAEKKFGDALEKAGLLGGGGLNGQLPSRVLSTRVKRQTEDAKCTAVLESWKAFNQSAKETCEDANKPLEQDEADKTVTALQAITGRTDLAGDLDSCQEETSSSSGVLAIVKIRVYFYWAVIWRATVIEVKITIIVIQYPNLPKPPTLGPTTVRITSLSTTANSTVTTAVSTGAPKRRVNIIKLVNQFRTV